MAYIDGFLLAVKADRKDAYREIAQMMWPIFRDHGAIATSECWQDDVPEGEVTSFPMAVQREADEVVVFSWIEWPDKATRDAGNRAVFEDPRFEGYEFDRSVLDPTRMVLGGFEVLFRPSG